MPGLIKPTPPQVSATQHINIHKSCTHTETSVLEARKSEYKVVFFFYLSACHSMYHSNVS